VNEQRVEPGYALEDSDLIAPLPQPLQPGEQAVISMDFVVDVPTESGGNYGIFARVDDILTPAHFYPMIAVYDDEGWNVEITPPAGDPTYVDAGYYLVRIDAPAGQTIVASGSEIGRAEQDGRQEITIAAGPARDFFFAASNRYEVISETVGETTVNAYATSDLADENALALRYATDALRSFNARYGLYPYTELDVVGTPTLAGGVEYPGLVVIALSIYDPDLQFFESATAHEVGHQWFYNMVGNDQLDDPWLDEALTQFVTMMYYNDVYGTEGYAGARAGMNGRWARLDYEDIPIGLPVAAYSDQEYGAIVYGRGPLFFEALAREMGIETFEAFLRDYVQTYKWDIATPEGLKALAEQHCGCDLTALFEEWVY
jgi:aminopeptidase N